MIWLNSQANANINVGTATVTVIGDGNYDGYVEKTFKIVAPEKKTKDIGECTITLGEDSYVSDGTEKKPEVTVKDGKTLLTEGKDYTLSYKDNINVGTAIVTITGKDSNVQKNDK